MLKYPKEPEPFRIEIEVTNYCNAKCTICPRDKLLRAKGFMEPKTFYNIIDKCETYREKLELNQMLGVYYVPTIVFSGFGEPLLHPELIHFIRYATEKNFVTHLITNGSLLDRKKIRELLDAGIKIIYFSFFGTSKDIYEMNMLGLNFEKSLRNVKYLISISKIKNVIIRIKTHKMLETDIVETRNFWRMLGVKVLEAKSLNNRTGYIQDGKYHFEDFISSDSNIWCGRFYLVNQIDWEGNVILCANDINSSFILGNINEVDFYTITLEKKKIKAPLPICKNCKGDNYRDGGLLKDMNEFILNEPDRRKLIWGNREKELYNRFISTPGLTW